MLVMIYHMLRDDVDYRELGHDHLDQLPPQRLKRYLVKRLEALGHEVTLRPATQAAYGVFSEHSYAYDSILHHSADLVRTARSCRRATRRSHTRRFT